MATTATHTHSIQMLHNSATSGGMPHGLGLLTTVASLPPKYRSRYLNIKTKCEIPLDLSVKPISPQIAQLQQIPQLPQLPQFPQIANDEDVPMATTFTEVYTEPCSEPESQCSSELGDEDEQELVATRSEVVVQLLQSQATAAVTITKIPKASTPPASEIANTTSNNKRKFSESSTDSIVERFITDVYTNPAKLPKTEEQVTTKRECTPLKPNRPPIDSAPKTAKSQPPSAKSSRNKATRKLKFDEETSSPVSGTIIRPLEDITDGTMQYSNGDIDPKYNIVEITDETKAELAAIKNVIGDYICRLCRLKFEDAFGLAQHRCACIVLIEYRCPECGKQFNCPANLASHRRWHKPKKEGGAVSKKENRNTTNNATANPSQSAAGSTTAAVTKKTEELAHACNECGKKFKRQAYLRKHQLTHANPKKSSPVVGKQQPPPSSTQISGAVTAEGTLISNVPVSESYQLCARSSSASSMQSYGSGGSHEDEGGVYSGVATSGGYEYDVADSMSECSTSSVGYGRLQIVESGLTEEENIAAAALTNLRNCASVIQHTTLAH